jgi:hypothetical protein
MGDEPRYEPYYGMMYHHNYGWVQDDRQFWRFAFDDGRDTPARAAGSGWFNIRGLNNDFKQGSLSQNLTGDMLFFKNMYDGTGWVPEWTYTVWEYPDGTFSHPLNVRLTGLVYVGSNQQTGGGPSPIELFNGTSGAYNGIIEWAQYLKNGEEPYTVKKPNDG